MQDEVTGAGGGATGAGGHTQRNHHGVGSPNGGLGAARATLGASGGAPGSGGGVPAGGGTPGSGGGPRGTPAQQHPHYTNEDVVLPPEACDQELLQYLGGTVGTSRWRPGGQSRAMHTLCWPGAVGCGTRARPAQC